MQTSDRPAPLPGLTALRFFAASYVLLFHAFPRPPVAPLHPSLPYRLIEAGFSGVSCFFVLSGFILAYTHAVVPDPRRFLRARFARIYPLYLFAFLWSLPPFLKQIIHLGQHAQLWAIPADLLLLQDWFPRLALLVNTPAWTLSCEAFFYLVFPFAVRQLAKYTAYALPLLAAFWLLQLLPPVLNDFWLARSHPAWQDFGSGLLQMPIARLGEFLAGIVLGLVFLRRQSGVKVPTMFPSWLPLFSLAVCIAFLSLNLQLPHEVLRNGLMLGPICLLIWSLAGTPSRFLSSRALQLGGEISYSVYLLQMPFDHTLTRISERFLHSGLQGPLWIIAVYPVAWLTYTYIEKPCRALLLHRRPLQSEKPIPTPQPDLP